MQTRTTNQMPLILNFVKPRDAKQLPESKADDVRYDPKTQITYYMGGGGKSVSKSGEYRKSRHDTGLEVHWLNDAANDNDD